MESSLLIPVNDVFVRAVGGAAAESLHEDTALQCPKSKRHPHRSLKVVKRLHHRGNASGAERRIAAAAVTGPLFGSTSIG